jgi:cytoskeleton-associated protein 5
MLSTKTPPAAPQVKPLSEALAVLIGDGAENVRNESAESLGVLMKIVGERAMNPILEPMDDLRKAKVKEAFEKAVVKCKVGGPPAPKAAAPAKAEPPKVCFFVYSTSCIPTECLLHQEKRTCYQV